MGTQVCSHAATSIREDVAVWDTAIQNQVQSELCVSVCGDATGGSGAPQGPSLVSLNQAVAQSASVPELR